MAFPLSLSRLTLSRLIAGLLACAACILACAATASAADITIGYTDPHGGTSAARAGTSDYQGNDAIETDVSVGLWTASSITDDGLVCNPSGPESEQCDVYDVFSGSYEAKPPCEPDGFDVLCPDAERFTANLGGGTNDSYTLDSPLQYQTATVNAGNGGDFIEGTNPPEYEGEFPDDDVFTGGNGNDRLIGGPGNDVIKGGPGNDVIDGRGGDDRLEGEGGNDEITGGSSGESLEAGGEGINELGIAFNPERPTGTATTPATRPSTGKAGSRPCPSSTRPGRSRRTSTGSPTAASPASGTRSRKTSPRSTAAKTTTRSPPARRR